MTVRTKDQLMVLMQRFIRDEKRGITLHHFASVTGVTAEYLKDVFIYKRFTLTHRLQAKLNRTWDLWEQGRIRVESPNGALWRTRVKIVPASQAKPLLRKTYRVNFDAGSLQLGVKKRSDYS